VTLLRGLGCSVARAAYAGLAAMALAGLAGCAAPRLIDSDVQSFTAAVPAVRPALYRFERLPSQADAALQDQTEALARVALAKVGLTPAPLVSGAVAGTAAAAPTARYAAQVSVQITAIVSPYPSASLGSFWGPRNAHHRDSLALMMEMPWYRHAVRILLRDSLSGQLVYETSASFDGPWADSGRLLPVVLDAALSGYPTPPVGPRKVVIELPGTPPASP
jgi:hypothetical protein